MPKTRSELHPNWKPEQCPFCSGHGLKSQYSRTGDDFLGATECGMCDGNGRIWRSPSGTRYAKYPGGPFIGRATDA